MIDPKSDLNLTGLSNANAIYPNIIHEDSAVSKSNFVNVTAQVAIDPGFGYDRAAL